MDIILPDVGYAPTTYLFLTFDSDGQGALLPHVSPFGEIGVVFGTARVDLDEGSHDVPDGQAYHESPEFGILLDRDGKAEEVLKRWTKEKANVIKIVTDGYQDPLQDWINKYDLGSCRVASYKHDGTDKASANAHKATVTITRTGYKKEQ
jgi:hypothetical protein